MNSFIRGVLHFLLLAPKCANFFRISFSAHAHIFVVIFDNTIRFKPDLFSFNRHALKNIPTTFIGLEKWLQELWRDKDQLLDNVYKEGIRFPASSSRQLQSQRILPLQYVTLFAWFFFIIFILSRLLSLSWTAFYMWTWIVLVSGAMALISNHSEGLQDIEILLDQKEFWPKVWKFLFENTVAKLKRKADHSKKE
jgi:hypothetical protein